EPGLRSVRGSTTFGQTGKTAASAQILHRAAAGTGLTTSSLCHLDARLRTRPRRQAENPDKSGRIFLVVTVAHGECSKISPVLRVFRATARDRNISFIKRQRDCPRQIVLRALDERI